MAPSKENIAVLTAIHIVSLSGYLRFCGNIAAVVSNITIQINPIQHSAKNMALTLRMSAGLSQAITEGHAYMLLPMKPKCVLTHKVLFPRSASLDYMIKDRNIDTHCWHLKPILDMPISLLKIPGICSCSAMLSKKAVPAV